MSLTVMSWNIRHFKGENQQRIDQVGDHIRDNDPDIFGIIEFKRQAKQAARRIISEEFVDYDF